MFLPDYVSKILNILYKNGYKAYAVGGCVRSNLLGDIPHDYDLTTNAVPSQIIDCFPDFHILTHGIEHGTVTVMSDSIPIEITTFRSEGTYSDNRHPDYISFASSIEEDLCRRDFTANAIAYSKDEGFIDPYGGINDIQNKILKSVGDPDARFSEDALRILRGLRFASVLGFDIENSTSKSIHKNAYLLQKISPERIFTEFTKLICGKNAAYILHEYSDVIEQFIPEISPSIGFEQNNIHHCYTVYEHILASLNAIEPDPILRYTMFFHDIGKPHSYSEDEKGGHFYKHHRISADTARNVLHRLRAPNKFTDQIVNLVYYHDRVTPETTAAMKRLIMKLGYENTLLLLQVNRADAMAQAKFQLEERLKHIDKLFQTAKKISEEPPIFSLKDLDINGYDIMSLGIEQGEKVGKILRKLLDKTINEELPNSKPDLLSYAKTLKDIL